MRKLILLSVALVFLAGCIRPPVSKMPHAFGQAKEVQDERNG